MSFTLCNNYLALFRQTVFAWAVLSLPGSHRPGTRRNATKAQSLAEEVRWDCSGPQRNTVHEWFRWQNPFVLQGETIL